MKRAAALLPSVVGLVALTAIVASAADWPQWRGLNRSAKVTDFKAPDQWPEQLKQQWKVTVGEGDATPSLVGDKLYVFSRQGGNEVIRALNAETGKQLWQDKYESDLADGGARKLHSGPRASPTVANGKVVTFGVHGMLSCLDAETGKLLWRKDDFEATPMFNTASSPLVVDGLCIGQFGGQANGAVVAYDLASGEEKWKWPGGNPTHASPVLLTLDGTKYVVAQAGGKLAALNSSNGEVAWQIEVGGGGFGRGRGGFGGGGFGGGRGRRGADGEGQRRGPGGDEGRGPGAAEQGARQGAPGDAVAQQEPGRGRGERGRGGRFGGGRGGRGGGFRDRFAATPIVDGQTIYHSGAGGGLKAYQLQKEGDKITSKEIWSNPEASISFNTPVLKDGLLFGVTGESQFFCIDAQSGKRLWTGPRDTGGGYGSVVDAGSVLLGITPGSGLVVIEPSAKAYNELARIPVSDSEVYAHLVVAGNRLFVKDWDSVALFTVE